MRAGMVALPEDHPWSSWHGNGAGRPDPLLSEHPTYRARGPTPAARRAAYRAPFAAGLDEETLATPRDAIQRGGVLGNDRFRREIEAAPRRRADPPRRGRPPKPEPPTVDGAPLHPLHPQPRT